MFLSRIYRDHRFRGFASVKFLDSDGVGCGGARFGFSLGEIGGVAVDVEAHVAGVKANYSIGMGSEVVQETSGALGGGSGSLRMRVCQGQRGGWSRRHKHNTRIPTISWSLVRPAGGSEAELSSSGTIGRSVGVFM
jgi:hypothetical protein